jgi:hypothetical protein
MNFINTIYSLNKPKIKLFIDNYIKIITNNNNIKYYDNKAKKEDVINEDAIKEFMNNEDIINEEAIKEFMNNEDMKKEDKKDENKDYTIKEDEPKKILTIIACHTNSIIKYNTLINNIPHLLYPNNDIIIINTSNEKYGDKIKNYMQSDEYKYKNNIIKYLEIPNNKYVDFGKFIYGLDYVKKNDMKYDFIVFVNDSIIIKNPIIYFYNLVIKNNKELYAYNDSSEKKYHYQSYLFAIRYDVIYKLINFFNQNKIHIHKNDDVVRIMELNLNEIYSNDNDCFLKLAKLPNNVGKNIYFHNKQLYTLLFTSGILPFIKLKTIKNI